MSKKNQKVVNYKPFRLNIGIAVFAIIFIYIVICVIMYFRSEKIAGYEVRIGSLSSVNTYKAFILREETVYNSEQTGYVNFYAQEGERVGCRNLVYTVDENHTLEDSLTGERTISSDELSSLKTKFIQMQKSFSEQNFDRIYTYQTQVLSMLMKYGNYAALRDIQQISATNSSFLHYGYATESGIIAYYTDGYESITLDTFTDDCMDSSNYEQKRRLNGEIVNAGDTVYKLSLNENWKLIIELNNKQYADLMNKTSVKVFFEDTQETSVAQIEFIVRNNKTYAVLNLDECMYDFISERYLDIEIETNEEEGLKIPVSSIVEKEFYIIPSDYLTKGGKNGKQGVNRITYSEDGSETVQFIELSVYSEKDGESYVDKSVLRPGDVIIKTESTERSTISKLGTLIGVYNINKGYADFKEITILYQNDEYAIVKPNTTYGLTVYDHIVLDTKTVNEDDFIYD